MRAAVVQTGAAVFDVARTLDKVELGASSASKQDAQLVVFPEAFVSAYPKGLDFGSTIGGRTPEGREEYRRYFDSAIEVPSVHTDLLGQMAGDLQQYMVIGVVERGGATLYCTALFFGPEGALLGKHRKLMPTGAERLVWGFGDGSTLPVFDTPFGRLGAVICWENYMPLLRMAMYAKGIQIYCAPTADSRPTWAPSMQHIALEGRCFVLSACQHLRRKDAPEHYAAIQGNEPDTVLMRGGSCIVSALGEILAGPVFDTDAILVQELDLGDLARAKYDFDVAGHYARSDVFRLHVNEAPMPPVVFEQRPL
ncbi:nitrilase-related carbon-nitrogen hydrolase [Paraburkholderia kirstenboschensis]|uniref:Nitrilase-related carbon-nitrogen hydrolase n=1 Tax=Paraburkholderia kirstenboschensis TaxID=1245436 RepID=A0ABZ0EK91_9BURK|nr:nitrilase-related carbon-nitrogen hydrolase [Paraburkholderia kirstenboschensis]WOD17355.1 nitrilase-related carbon-nitrogen hydrolase [Paraburkholderia kirstenboschensis]